MDKIIAWFELFGFDAADATIQRDISAIETLIAGWGERDSDYITLGVIITDKSDGMCDRYCDRREISIAVGKAAERVIVAKDALPVSDIIASEFAALGRSDLAQYFQTEEIYDFIATVGELYAARAGA